MSLIVLILFMALTVVAVAAGISRSSEYFDTWRQVWSLFRVDLEAPPPQFSRIRLFFEPSRVARLTGRKKFEEYGEFDVSAQDDGLWLTYLGPQPLKSKQIAFIPWASTRLVGNYEDMRCLQLTGHLKLKVLVPQKLAGRIQQTNPADK